MRKKHLHTQCHCTESSKTLWISTGIFLDCVRNLHLLVRTLFRTFSLTFFFSTHSLSLSLVYLFCLDLLLSIRMRFLLFSIPIVNPFSNGSQFNRDRNGKINGDTEHHSEQQQQQRIEPCYFNLIF